MLLVCCFVLFCVVLCCFVLCFCRVPAVCRESAIFPTVIKSYSQFCHPNFEGMTYLARIYGIGSKVGQSYTPSLFISR
jgi:hypothetical protein